MSDSSGSQCFDNIDQLWQTHHRRTEGNSSIHRVGAVYIPIHEDRIKHLIAILKLLLRSQESLWPIVVAIGVFCSRFHEATTSLDMVDQHLDRDFLKSWLKSQLQALFAFAFSVALFDEVVVYRLKRGLRSRSFPRAASTQDYASTPVRSGRQVRNTW